MARSQKKTGSMNVESTTVKKTYLSQSDVPRHSLDEALRVANAISDEYGKQPTRPMDVARALGILPTTGQFRSLAGAALAYGLTDGGAFADLIALSDLGRRVVSPTQEGDDLAAKREALMRPRVVREFLAKYDGSKLPSETIGRNVLEAMGFPEKSTERTLHLITASAQSLGLLTEIKGQKLVNLRPPTDVAGERTSPTTDEGALVGKETVVPDRRQAFGSPPLSSDGQREVAPKDALVKNRKVYISHGSNKRIVDQLKELLSFGDFEAVVSEEKETTARPVSEKVLGEMRGCGAGIIHVGAEQTIVDKDGAEHSLLNYNVLIEIGAAMALYGANYILLVQAGTKLPSNLQGLYEARFKGEALDHDATMKLLRTLKEFKS